MGRLVGIDATIPGHGTIVNYSTSFEGNEVQNLIEDEITAGDRWDVNITGGAKEYTARIEAELCSGAIFYLVLGSMTPASIGSGNATVTPWETLPVSSISASSEAGTMSFGECKCDRLRISWAAGEFTSYEAEFVCETTVSAAGVSGSCTWTHLAPTGGSVRVMITGTTLTEMQSGNLEIINNLEPRYACGLGKDPQTIREQRLEVSGAITVGQADIANFITGGRSLNILMTGIGKSEGGTLEIQCGSVWFDELPDEFTGHDVYEVEFTWTAQPITGGDIIKVLDKTSVSVW